MLYGKGKDMKRVLMTMAVLAVMMASVAVAQCPSQCPKKAACKCEACGCTADGKKAGCKCDKCSCGKKAECPKASEAAKKKSCCAK